MEEIDKILINLQYKAKREAINQLKKEYKNNSKVLKILKKEEKKLPKNY